MILRKWEEVISRNWSVESKERNDGRHNQPQQALYQEEHKSPKANSFDPAFDLNRSHAFELKKISLSEICRLELSSERTKMYIAQHSNANGGNPRYPSTGISKILMLPK